MKSGFSHSCFPSDASLAQRASALDRGAAAMRAFVYDRNFEAPCTSVELPYISVEERRSRPGSGPVVAIQPTRQSRLSPFRAVEIQPKLLFATLFCRTGNEQRFVSGFTAFRCPITIVIIPICDRRSSANSLLSQLVSNQLGLNTRLDRGPRALARGIGAGARSCKGWVRDGRRWARESDAPGRPRSDGSNFDV
jgi:hypothetical protein